MLLIQSISDIPLGQHWAIIQETSVHIPGSERSIRTYTTYTVFNNLVDFRGAMLGLQKQNKPFRGIYVKGSYTIETSISINIKEPGEGDVA